MKLLSWTMSLVVSWSTFATAFNTSGTVEVDLIFPRNESYSEPWPMPIIFSIRNPSLAYRLQPVIEYTIYNSSDTTTQEDLRQAKAVAHHNATLSSYDPDSSDASPYLLRDYTNNLKSEGQYALIWRLHWHSCTENSSRLSPHLWTGGIYFSTTTSRWGQKVDLLAGTSNETASCTSPGREMRSMGTAIEVGGLHNISMGTWEAVSNCAEVVSQEGLAEPCKIKIDDGAASGIWAAVNETMCQDRPYPGEDTSGLVVCPSQKGDAQKAAVRGLALSLVVMGLLLHVT